MSSVHSTVKPCRFIDIGVNLTDPVFRGVYRGRTKHKDDLEAVLERSSSAGVKSIIITGGSLSESREALRLAAQHGLFATVGCHPTRVTEFEHHEPGGAEGYLSALDQLISEHLTGLGHAVAIGECGLDYDRTHFAEPDIQRKHFRSQLSLAKKYHLPLFLHSRAAHRDLVDILRDEGFGHDGGRAVGGKGGVVHSFTGTAEEVNELAKTIRWTWVSLSGSLLRAVGSVNGCSLKTEENLQAARAIHANKLLLETDAPWCSMTGGHASKHQLSTMPANLRELHFPTACKPENFIYGRPVKGRNEPAAIGGVAWVLHELHQIPFEELTEQAWKNTVELFGLVELF